MTGWGGGGRPRRERPVCPHFPAWAGRELHIQTPAAGELGEAHLSEAGHLRAGMTLGMHPKLGR